MYLVELRPGKEELFRTGDELAAAIRNGDVDMHSRIYHRATSKWISVTLHPQYKAIIAAQPAGPPLPPLERSNWTFFNDSADALAGANDTSADSTGDDESGDGHGPAWRRSVALSVTAGLLLLGLQIASSSPKPPWARRAAAPEQPEPMLPAATRPDRRVSPTVSLTSSHASLADLGRSYVTASRPLDTLPETATANPAVESPADAPAPAGLPAAPRLRNKSLTAAAATATADSAPRAVPQGKIRSVEDLLHRWSAAHDSVQARLESGVRVARLGQLFAPERLTPTGGVTETRMSLAGMANFVRIYRQQQTAIERRYQELFAANAKAQGWSPSAVREWYGKDSPRETPELAGLTSSLLDQVDTLLGVLDAQAGTYTVSAATIRFEDRSAARAYAALRRRITTTVDSAKIVGGIEGQGPMRYLLQAIGTTRLPQAI